MADMYRLLVCLVGLAVTVPGVWGLPNGPPLAACTHMRPGTQVGVIGDEGHTRYPMNEFPVAGYTRIPPYYIQVHGNHTYVPGRNVPVSIVANDTFQYNKYRGVLMQARRLVCYVDNYTMTVEDAPLGIFNVPLSATQTLLKPLSCGNIDRSAVGHRSPAFKVNETLTWAPPTQMTGHIVFKATVVKEALTYWTNIYSPILVDPTIAAPQKCGAITFLAQPVTLLLCGLLVVMWQR